MRQFLHQNLLFVPKNQHAHLIVNVEEKREEYAKVGVANVYPIPRIVSGANGATGVLAPKVVELDLKKGTVKYPNTLSMEENCVLDKLMKQSSVQINHVQLTANGAPGATGVLVPKPVEMECNKDGEFTSNMQPMEAVLVKGNLRRQDHA